MINLENWLINQNDFSALCLNTATDNGARLCRAWLLRGCKNHPDHENAKQLLQNTEISTVSDFLSLTLSTLERVPESEALAPWKIFCPAAEEASSDAEAMAYEIEKRRYLSNVKLPKAPIRKPAQELLLTTNALLSPPIDPESTNIPQEIKAEARRFAISPQTFWYDHPIHLDSSLEENEIVYGLSALDRAMAYEVKTGLLGENERLDVVMSISVTHEGMENLALCYLKALIQRHLKLRHLRVFLFDETRCQKIIKCLCSGDTATLHVFGVNGSYGRHYSFLKAVLLLWQMTINPYARFTFKFDLDQVFDQSKLFSHTGKSALAAICNPIWGGSALDRDGCNVDLGMLAGGLINKEDASKGLYVPDVERPGHNPYSNQLDSRRIFCPQWPQAISTETEILQEKKVYQRIHVTGGTTGITAEALQKWHPFTPSFINRAEDQAYGLSTLTKEGYLGHLHANGLIMRHDKGMFATRSIENAHDGKMIGNIERLLLFSHYAKFHKLGFNNVQDHLWPFTSCYVHSHAVGLSGLIFALDGAVQGGRFVAQGAPRLKNCLNFCQYKIKHQFDFEESGWETVYNCLASQTNASGELLGLVKDSLVTGGC